MSVIKSTILVIDDEPQIRKLLRVILQTEGYNVEEAENGKQGVRLSMSIKPDAIVLDLSLPDMDGIEVIHHLRSWAQIPILMLSVCAEDQEIIRALDAGADDYVIKPFVADVFMARLRSMLRKAAREEGGAPEISNGEIHMDLVKHEVLIHGKTVKLSPKEYALLRYLMINKGKMLTHKQILKEVWGSAHGEDTQYLRVYIGQLRAKIEEDISSPNYIITEPGIGYRMNIIKSPVNA